MCACVVCVTIHHYESICTIVRSIVYIKRLCARECVSISHGYIGARGVHVLVVFPQVHLEMSWWQSSENGETSSGDLAAFEFRHETVNMSWSTWIEFVRMLCKLYQNNGPLQFQMLRPN